MPDDREPLGRLVHDTRLAAEADRAAAEGRTKFDLKSWEDRTEHQRELDMRIGSAVAAQAVADAGLENERMKAQILVLAAHFLTFRDALEFKIAWMETEYQAKPYRAALAILPGGGEEGTDRG